MTPKVLLAHPGTQYSYHLAAQLERKGLLHKYITGFTIPNSGAIYKLYKMLSAKMQQKLSTRTINLPADKVELHAMLELNALISMKRGKSSESAFYKRNKAFQNVISDEAIKAVDVVIGFDTSSWILAERCKKLNKRFILDVSIGHPVIKEDIYKELARLYPEWLEQIKPKSDFLIELEMREIELADTIVVPSNFVRNTYLQNGIATNKIVVNPFGTNVSSFAMVPYKYTQPSFLFFGGLTARKGLPFLLDVWKVFNEKYPGCNLILAGYGQIPAGYKMPASVKNIGLVKPQDRQRLFDMADVFVFPSFFEGLAQVQIEAGACGLPIIGSTQSGAADIVEEGKSGFVVTPGNNEQLFDAMEYFVKNQEQIVPMGQLARKTMLNNFTWDAYGDRWADILLN